MNQTELIENVSGKLTGFLENWQTCTYYVGEEANLAYYCAETPFSLEDSELFKKAFNRKKGEDHVMYILYADLNSITDFKIKQYNSEISDIEKKIQALDSKWENKNIIPKLFETGKKDYERERKRLEKRLEMYRDFKKRGKENRDELSKKYSEPHVILQMGKCTNRDFEARSNHSRFTLVGNKETTAKIMDYLKQNPEEVTSIMRSIFDPDKCEYSLDTSSVKEEEKYFDPFSLVKEINIFDYRTPSNNMVWQKD